MKSKTRDTMIGLAAVAALGAAGWGTYHLLAGDDVGAQGTEHLVNQVWIDHVPTDERDMVRGMVFIDHRQGKFGAITMSSRWRAFIEGLMWKLDGDKLTIVMPQDRRRARVQARTWRCEGEAPAPFELCLELSVGNDSMLLYSREDWVIEPHDGGASLLGEYPELAGVLQGATSAPLQAGTEIDESELVDDAQFIFE